MSYTSEQQNIIDHDPTKHARVLAGPGTGKSFTSVGLLERLTRERPDLRSRILTFARAATAEFAEKLGDAELQGFGVAPPSTVHAFALHLLASGGPGDLPQPIRIPDKWETKRIVHRDLVAALRARGVEAKIRLVSELEQEMAAGWQSLDEEERLLADREPALRTGYLAEWGAHRQRYGYTLLAELTFRAGRLAEDQLQG